MTTHNTHDQNSTEHRHISLAFMEVITRAGKRFEKSFLPLLALSVIAFAIVVSSGLFAAAILSGLYIVLPTSLLSIAILTVVGLMFLSAILFAYCAVPIMGLKLIEKPSYEFEELFKKSIKQVPKVFAVMALVGLAQIGGFILGILPGIWLAIVLYFVFIIITLEKKDHKQAIAQSAFLIKGNFWKVFGFVCVLLIVAMLISYIPVFGILLGVVFGFFARTLVFELYKTLSHNRVTDSSIVHKNKRLVNVVYAFAAFAVLAIVLVTVIAVFLISTFRESDITPYNTNNFESSKIYQNNY